MPLPGKAMQVAIHVWRELELAKSNEVSISMTGMIGISRFAASRGLVRLEKAGLVSVVRRAGRKARVLVLSTRLTKEKLPDAATTVGTSQVITAPDVQGQG
jgi:DNA-binding transcriptional ArsR family regulator